MLKTKGFYRFSIRPQPAGNLPAPPRERQLGPSRRPTKQEPFARRSREKKSTKNMTTKGVEILKMDAKRRAQLEKHFDSKIIILKMDVTSLAQVGQSLECNGQR